MQVPAFGLIQIFLTIGAAEFYMHKGKITPDNMFDDGRKPGDFGWGKADMTMATKEVLQPLRPCSPSGRAVRHAWF